MFLGAAQVSPEEAAVLGGLVIGVVLIVLLVTLAISVIICVLLYKCFQAVPPEHRKQEPGLVWLLLIPCFNIVWNFFVFPRLSDSYQSYFAAIGRKDVGDCGRNIGLAYSICVACSVIPYLNTFTGLASLVLLIIYLIKAWDLKNQIQSGAPAQPPQA